jgi:hypothetical protein
MGKIYSIRFNEEEHKAVRDDPTLHPEHTITSLIKARLFERRERSRVTISLEDEIFHGKIRNLLSCIKDDRTRNINIDSALDELVKLIEERIGLLTK